MKAIKALSIILFLYSGASYSQSSTAKTNVVKYLKSILNDPYSYKPVRWGKLEAVYTTFELSKDGKDLEEDLKLSDDFDKEIDDKVKGIIRAYDAANKEYNQDTIVQKFSEAKLWNKRMHDSLIQVIALKKAKFKPQLSNYIVYHTFRAKNAYNAYRLTTYYFILNKNYKVTSHGNDEDDKRKYQEIMNKIEALRTDN